MHNFMVDYVADYIWPAEFEKEPDTRTRLQRVLDGDEEDPYSYSVAYQGEPKTLLSTPGGTIPLAIQRLDWAKDLQELRPKPLTLLFDDMWEA